MNTSFLFNGVGSRIFTENTVKNFLIQVENGRINILPVALSYSVLRGFMLGKTRPAEGFNAALGQLLTANVSGEFSNGVYGIESHKSGWYTLVQTDRDHMPAVLITDANEPITNDQRSALTAYG
jgi:hypothetical protein